MAGKVLVTLIKSKIMQFDWSSFLLDQKESLNLPIFLKFRQGIMLLDSYKFYDQYNKVCNSKF